MFPERVLRRNTVIIRLTSSQGTQPHL